MLEELGNDLKKIALVGVGAVTILAEKGGEFAKECIEKGTRYGDDGFPQSKGRAGRQGA